MAAKKRAFLTFERGLISSLPVSMNCHFNSFKTLCFHLKKPKLDGSRRTNEPLDDALKIVARRAY
jgi:hypothetical protein